MQHIVANPISRGAFINVAAFVSWPEKAGTTYEGKMVEETNEEVLMQHFAGWEDEVQQLLQVSVPRHFYAEVQSSNLMSRSA